MSPLPQYKLTPEFCAGRTLVFRPQSVEEAQVMQERLFALGFGWMNGGQSLSPMKKVLSQGMTLEHGRIVFGADPNGILCGLNARNELEAMMDGLDHKFVINLFNRAAAREDDLSRRIAALEEKMAEMSKKLDQALDLTPRTLDKPRPKTP